MTDTPTPEAAAEALKGVTPDAERPAYLIQKHGGYYRPNCQGYTDSAIQAGRYTLKQAITYTHPNGPDGPRDGMSYIHEDEVKDTDWQAYRALAADRDAQKARADAAEVKLSCVISHATMGAIQDQSLSLNEIGVAITRIRNECHAEKTAAEAKVAKLVGVLQRIADSDESDPDLNEWGASAVARAIITEVQG